MAAAQGLLGVQALPLGGDACRIAGQARGLDTGQEQRANDFRT